MHLERCSHGDPGAATTNRTDELELIGPVSIEVCSHFLGGSAACSNRGLSSPVLTKDGVVSVVRRMRIVSHWKRAPAPPRRRNGRHVRPRCNNRAWDRPPPPSFAGREELAREHGEANRN